MSIVAFANKAFPTTRWTLLRRMSDDDEVATARSLEVLYRAYWQPLNSLVRRHGYSAHEAEDITQEYLLKLNRNGSWNAADPAKGRLRDYLSAGLRRFILDYRGKCSRRPQSSSDSSELPEHPDPVEESFDREWAEQLFRRAQWTVLSRFEQSRDGAVMRQLFALMLGGNEGPTYAALSTSMGLSEDAIKMRMMRLRAFWRETLREEIRCTVGRTSEIDDELRHLIRVLSHGR